MKEDDYPCKSFHVVGLQSVLWNLMTINSAQESGFKGTAGGNEEAASVFTPAIFDMDEFVCRSMGDLGLSRDVATIFIDRAPEYIESIRNGVAEQDPVFLIQSAHKLRGSAANLSLPSLSEVAGLIESMAGEGDLVGAGELLPELELQFGRALAALEEMILFPEKKGAP